MSSQRRPLRRSDRTPFGDRMLELGRAVCPGRHVWDGPRELTVMEKLVRIGGTRSRQTTDRAGAGARLLLQTGPVPTDCIFCQIAAGDAPAYVVAEDDAVVAFLDRAPATEGHTLIVPRSHASDIWEVSDRDAAAVMVMAKRVARVLDERLSPDGLNLTQSNRQAGWQDVFHFHLHVIPRWSGDGLTRMWRADHADEVRLAATLAQLR